MVHDVLGPRSKLRVRLRYTACYQLLDCDARNNSHTKASYGRCYLKF
jgi:hypothetical protein